MTRFARWIKFSRCERGSVMPLVAFAAMMLICTAGAAIDMGRIQIVQSRLQTSLDNAGLAAGANASTTNANTQALNYFNANYPASYLGSTVHDWSVIVATDNTMISLSAQADVPMTFMQLFQISKVTVSASTQITRQSAGMELVLVLDNTGSMNCLVTNENSCSGGSSSKIAALKTAASTLLDVLYGTTTNTVSNLWVGVVPFSQTVNIGTANSAWLDSTYDATLDFGPTITGTSCQSYTGNATTLSGGEDFAGTQATGVITFTSNPSNGKTIVLNGVTWTFVTSGGGGATTKTNIGTNLTNTLTNLATNLNASTNNSIKVATYYVTSTLLEITYDTAGTAGNAYTLSAGNAPASVTTPTSAGTYNSAPKCTYTLTGKSATPIFLKSDITTTNWGGCVMARTNPYDTTDDTPATAPFQAYDYPPFQNGSASYDPWMTVSTSNSPYITTTTYKYSYNSSFPGYYGPNLFCPQAVLPMVAEKNTVVSEINAMSAGGSTLIDVGMAWGYRMLSPNWQGLWGGEMNTNNLPLAYHTPLMNKVLILMTDGENSVDPSNFTAYGWMSNGSLGSTTNTTTADNTLDTRTLAVCTALKNNGVIIYTIGFGTASDVNTTLLTSCASQPSYFFLAPTNAQLQSAFQQIGDSLANLRVSK